MAYENGKTYWFISHSGTGRALSVYGNSQVSQNRNVILWDKQSVNDQKWLVSIYNGFGRIRSALDNSYALNIWTGGNNPNNCDIHTWADNQNDSKVDFLTVSASENLYKIKLLNYNLLMTATGSTNGNDVRWQAPNGASNQIWKLVDVSGGGTPPSGNQGGGVGPHGNYVYPTVCKSVSQKYYNNINDPDDHPAVDIRDRATDHNIYAFADGKVAFVQDIDSPAPGTGMWTMGNCIALNHLNPISNRQGNYARTIYMHMKNPSTLRPGAIVKKGQILGTIGNTGKSSGNHLHFSLSTGDLADMSPESTGWISIASLPDFDPFLVLPAYYYEP